MRVLYVDPDGDACADVRDALASDGATVSVASSASDGLDALVGEVWDTVVCEHALPGTDGFGFLERVGAVDPAVPVVVYTGAGSETLAGEYVAAGADGYVTKEEGPGVLVDRIESLTSDASAPTADDAGVGEDPATGPTSDRLSLLVDQAPLGIVEWDLEFRVVGWNPAATEIFGYDRSTALGRTAWDLLVPEQERASVEAIWSRLLDGGEPDRGVNENVRVDGTTVTCEWHNAPMTDADGDVVGVLSFVRDVSGEVRRADQLEALQETSRQLMGMGSRVAVAEAVVEAAESVLHQHLTAIRLYDDDRDVLEAVAMTDRGADMVGDLAYVPPPVGPGDGLVWDVFESGEPTVAGSAATTESVYGEALPVERVFVQPVGDHGVLVFGAHESGSFDEIDRRMASILATTAAAAMDSAVRAQELQRAETILEAAGDGVFAIDGDGRFVQANDRFVEMLGSDRDGLIGADPSTFLSESDYERGRSRVADLFSGDAEVVTYEATIERTDGSDTPVEVSQSRLPGDRFSGTVGTVRDITDRRRIETELRERKEKIESLHEVATCLDDCETDEDIASVAVEAAADILNFDSCTLALRDGEEFVVMARSGLSPDEMADRVPIEGTVAGRVLRRGETIVVDDIAADDDAAAIHPEFRSVLTIPLGDGGVFQAISTVRGDYDESDAELAELLGAHVTNAFDRVSFEAELRSERDRMAALFDNVPDPVASVLHTDDGPIVQSVNAAFEEVFGYDASEIVGESIDEYIVSPGDRAEAAGMNERAKAGELLEREVRRRTADGLRDFRLTVVPVDLDEESPATFGVYTDVTEQKQRRERVEVLNRVLRHDLRNGMNIVRGSAELLADSVEGEAVVHAESILDQAADLLSLAARTRAVERAFDRGGTPAEPIELVSVLEQAVATLADRFPAVDVSTSFPSTAAVRGNSLLELALLDVLENAVVHNDKQSPHVDVDVAFGADDTVEITVADDGPGIPETERRLLVGEEEITQLRHASGLGLWLVNWAVTHAGGELAFDDNEPRGSVVTIRLPRADTEPRAPSIEGE